MAVAKVNKAIANGHDDPARPRKPERSNGRERYAVLCAAAEAILEREDVSALSIQRIAQVAGVPMASVYHFFPSPAAACVALAESYLDAFASQVAAPLTPIEAASWRNVVDTLMTRTVRFYRAHPYAQRLTLGSDYSWHIRQADLSNNLAMAQTIREHLREEFATIEADELLAAITVGISVGDAVWSLSVAQHGCITGALADEARRAVKAYLAARLIPERG